MALVLEFISKTEEFEESHSVINVYFISHTVSIYILF